MKQLVTLALVTLLTTGASSALAERADREKPINLEADRITVDDVKKTQVFDGNVILSQGTLQIRASKLVVTQDADGFQKGVATGGPNGLARFRQKREGRTDFVEGEGERIVHDARGDKTEFFQRAWVKSGTDEIRGNYISYDALTEKYLVTSGSTGAGKAPGTAGETPGRVRAIIQPKGKNLENPAEKKSEPTQVKPATAPSPSGE